MRLQKLLGADGFEAGEESALSELRQKASAGPSQTKITEDKGLLQGAAAWIDNDHATLTSDAKNRVAALKMLRHVYLLNKSGNRKVWIHSLPGVFTDWASRHFKDKVAQAGPAKDLLRKTNEHFSEQQKRYLANSTIQASAWCQKAGIVLAESSGMASPGRDKARDVVKRWFAEPALADATVDT